MKSISIWAHIRNLRPLAFFFLALCFVLRVAFTVWSIQQGGRLGVLATVEAFIIGPIFDIATFVFIAAPWIIAGAVLPARESEFKLRRGYQRVRAVLLTMMVFVICLSAVSEITFWNEFHSRFNFIAVDYLIYTTEVLKNIWESYPVSWIIAGLIIFSIFAARLVSGRMQTVVVYRGQGLQRMAAIVLIALLCWADFAWFPTGLSSIPGEYETHEIAKNGIYSLFSAYLHNELDYDTFYKTLDVKQAFSLVRAQLATEGTLTNDPISIAHDIHVAGEFAKRNVVLVSMESLSASYLKAYGPGKGLTPTLDRLSNDGLFYRNIFSTGTRTVRGLEALSLSIPPTPGQSIVRRPHNEDLYNLGSYLKSAGYETEFVYGGHGYFDNMNGFFSANGFGIVDESNAAHADVTFSNAWGMCDQDLFRMAIRHADDIAALGKPFFQLIMTTSNHRPYTYPQKVAIPSGSGRDGAVQYADWAISAFLDEAKTKPWYKNTLFVFVADHDAAVAGNTEVPVRDYRIPLIFYAPDFVAPKTETQLGSQIDVVPTIMGLLNASYNSHFFGHDLTRDHSERAVLGTYQKVGLFEDGILTLLGPNKKVDQYKVDAADNQTILNPPRQDLIDRAVAYYQSASYLFKNRLMKSKGDEKIENLH